MPAQGGGRGLSGPLSLACESLQTIGVASDALSGVRDRVRAEAPEGPLLLGAVPPGRLEAGEGPGPG